jgi:hypothetical protein
VTCEGVFTVLPNSSEEFLDASDGCGSFTA